jgi:hypothetical protein
MKIININTNKVLFLDTYIFNKNYKHSSFTKKCHSYAKFNQPILPSYKSYLCFEGPIQLIKKKLKQANFCGKGVSQPKYI